MDTLQVTFKPLFFASLIKATDFFVEIVGMCSFPHVYSSIYKSLII